MLIGVICPDVAVCPRGYGWYPLSDKHGGGQKCLLVQIRFCPTSHVGCIFVCMCQDSSITKDPFGYSFNLESTRGQACIAALLLHTIPGFNKLIPACSNANHVCSIRTDPTCVEPIRPGQQLTCAKERFHEVKEEIAKLHNETADHGLYRQLTRTSAFSLVSRKPKAESATCAIKPLVHFAKGC